MGEAMNDIILLHQLENVITKNIESSKIYPKLLHVWDLNTKLLDDYKSFRKVGLKPHLARGLIAEIMCKYVIKHWANEKGLDYKLYSNLLLPRIDGGTTQLDLLMITKDFSICVECKSLYGKMNINNGVISSSRGKRDMKPWRQNMGHIMSVKEVLKDYDLYMHNVVYLFSYGSILEYNPVVDNKLMVNINSMTLLDSIIKDRSSYHYKPLSDREIEEIDEILREYYPNVKQEIEHIRFINETIATRQ